MKNQQELFQYLKDNINSHTLEIKGNMITGKRLYKTRSFSNFKITFLKNSNEVSIKNTSHKSYTMRFTDEGYLLCHMGCMVSFK